MPQGEIGVAWILGREVEGKIPICQGVLVCSLDGLNHLRRPTRSRSFLLTSHVILNHDLHVLHSGLQRPIRVELATNLTSSAALTQDHTVTTGDDGTVVIDVQHMDGDGGVANHARVIWKTVRHELKQLTCRRSNCSAGQSGGRLMVQFFRQRC